MHATLAGQSSLDPDTPEEVKNVIEWLNANVGAVQGVAVVVLVAVTAYYAWQTRQTVLEMRAARRDRPRLDVFMGDDGSYADNAGEYSAVLVNPGLVPIVVTELREVVVSAEGREIALSEARFRHPSTDDPERQAVVTGLSWALGPNGFALWRRTLEANFAGGGAYEVKLDLTYMPGSQLVHEVCPLAARAAAVSSAGELTSQTG